MTPKRFWSVVLAGLVLAGAAYCLIYATQMAKMRGMEKKSGPELAWLKAEFHLDDAQFQCVCDLHQKYLAACAQRCEKIAAENIALQKLIATSTNVTPEIEAALTATAAMRHECETEMLKHFYEVSRAMPPEQGHRYLDWICAQTLLPSHMAMTPAAAPAHE